MRHRDLASRGGEQPAICGGAGEPPHRPRAACRKVLAGAGLGQHDQAGVACRAPGGAGAGGPQCARVDFHARQARAHRVQTSPEGGQRARALQASAQKSTQLRAPRAPAQTGSQNLNSRPRAWSRPAHQTPLPLPPSGYSFAPVIFIPSSEPAPPRSPSAARALRMQRTGLSNLCPRPLSALRSKMDASARQWRPSGLSGTLLHRKQPVRISSARRRAKEGPYGTGQLDERRPRVATSETSPQTPTLSRWAGRWAHTSHAQRQQRAA